MSTPTEPEAPSDLTAPEPWVELRVLVPAEWKQWLKEIAEVRAMSVSALVRQCIRALMIQRHEAS